MIDKRDASHFVWGNGCEGWQLLKAEGLNVVEERISSNCSEVRHLHENSRQFIYVIAGICRWRLTAKNLTCCLVKELK